MKTFAACIIIFLSAYLIGGINPAYIISKRRGVDIRQFGTGNAGASNAMILFGKKAGIMIALLDIFKAYMLVRVSSILFPYVRVSKELAGAGCIIGHMLPVQMHFRGGKGLACLGGVILAYSARCFLIILSAGILLALITRYFAVIPITAAAAFPIIYIVSGGCLTGFMLYNASSVIMEIKHVENIRRIRSGSELRISYLWDKVSPLLGSRSEDERRGAAEEELHNDN